MLDRTHSAGMGREDRMIDLSNLEAWFVTGSQHLYGAETLKKVGQHASAIATALGRISRDAREDCRETGDDEQRVDSPVVPEC
jgi:hypothetical protein